MNIPVTEWFPAEVKPVHAGWYQVRATTWFKHVVYRLYWTGSRWAYKKKGATAYCDKWRGLTSPHPEWKP